MVRSVRHFCNNLFADQHNDTTDGALAAKVAPSEFTSSDMPLAEAKRFHHAQSVRVRLEFCVYPLKDNSLTSAHFTTS